MQSPNSGLPLQALAGSTSSSSIEAYRVEISSRLFLWHTECSLFPDTCLCCCSPWIPLHSWSPGQLKNCSSSLLAGWLSHCCLKWRVARFVPPRRAKQNIYTIKMSTFLMYLAQAATNDYFYHYPLVNTTQGEKRQQTVWEARRMDVE